MALVVYKGQLVTPMELRMIKEREKAEEEARQRAKEERKPPERKKIPKRPTTPMELKTKTEYEKAREEDAKKPEKEKKIKRKPIQKTGPLDFEPYPTTPPPPMPKAVKEFQDVWLKYEQTMGEPSVYLRGLAGKTLSKAEEAKLSGKHGMAGLLFSTYMIERTGASIWDIATMRFRPLAIAETVASTLKLVDPKFRGEVGKAIVADPGGFTAELAGGLLGESLFRTGFRYAKGKYQAFRQARFEKKYPVEDFLPYEQELLTPQPTQDIDFRSLITEERARPVVWEYRGGRRPTISVSQKPPTLKEYPDPTRVELMGGKAIIDLVTLEEVSKARMTIEPAWIPGLRISDIGPTITEPYAGTFPYISSILAVAHALEKARKEKIREPSRLKTTTRKEQPDIGIAPIRKFKPIGRGRRRMREPTLPEYIVGPTEIEEQVQPTLPGYIQEPITRTRTRKRTVQEPMPIMELPPISIQITRAIPSIPEIEELKRGRQQSTFRYELKKGRGLGFLDLVKIGEIREYKVKTPKELMKELSW